MRILVRVVSVLGLLACAALFCVGVALSGLSGDGAPQHQHISIWRNVFGSLIVFSPFIYFSICFGTSFAKQRRGVRPWGIVAHLFLLYFNFGTLAVILSGSPQHTESLFALIVAVSVSVIFTSLWLAMYRSLPKQIKAPGTFITK